MLAATLPELPPQLGSRYAANSGFDAAGWIMEHLPDAIGPMPWSGGNKYVLPECPWNPSHRKTAYVVVMAGGALKAGCLKASCGGGGTNRWHDLRDMLEPNLRDRQIPVPDAGRVRGDGYLGQRINVRDPASGFRLTPIGDLLREPEADVEWVWDDTLPSGGLSIVSGKPKAGKSTLVRALALSIARGEPFLGRPTTRGPAVYLALEEKRGQVQAHFKRMGARVDDPLAVHVGAAPEDALTQLEVLVAERNPSLVIIDPLNRFARIRDLNDYSMVDARIAPLMALARTTGAHLLLVHHEGKGANLRDAGDSILGSTALFAAVDAAISVRRIDSRRTLESIQRYGADFARTVIEMDEGTGCVSAVGTVAEHHARTVREDVIAALDASEEGLTRDAIQEQTDHRRQDVTRVLKDMREDGQVTVEGKGIKGDPLRYSLQRMPFRLPTLYAGNGGTECGLPHDEAMNSVPPSWERNLDVAGQRNGSEGPTRELRI